MECTVKELCDIYNVTRTTIERWRKYKNLPFKKRGRNVIFILEDVEKWFRENNKAIEYNYKETPAN